MKVYCFYLHNKKKSLDDFVVSFPGTSVQKGDLEYNLYAITNNKKYSKIFKKSRDMESFYEKVLIMNDDEYTNLCNRYEHTILRYYGYKNEYIINKRFQSKTVKILSTKGEYYEVMLQQDYYVDKIITEDNRFMRIDKKYFNKKFYKFLCEKFKFDLLGGGNAEYPTEDELPFMEVDVNEVSLFIYLFKNTFKDGGSKVYESLEIY